MSHNRFLSVKCLSRLELGKVSGFCVVLHFIRLWMLLSSGDYARRNYAKNADFPNQANLPNFKKVTTF
jgi:hypothetical protein